MWEYKPEEPFKVEKLTDAQMRERIMYLADCTKWAGLSLICLIMSVVVLFMGRFWYAVLLFVMSNVFITTSISYRRKAEEVGHG